MKPWLKYHRLSAVFLLSMTFLTISAQEDNSYMHYDSVTYRLYLQKDWKELTREVNAALHHGIDYYYLRMRAGIAFYERGNYMKALSHFRKAYDMNSIEPVLMEYIYYSLVWTGRKQDALLFYLKNEQFLKNKISEGIKPVRSFTVDASWHFNLNNDLQTYFNDQMLSGLEGYQTITRWFFSGSFLLKHDLGKRVNLLHGATFLNKNNFYHRRDLTSTFETYEHYIRQYQYYASLNIDPGGGFIISPSFHYIHYVSPGLSYRQRGIGNNLIIPSESADFWLGRLSLLKRVRLFDLQAGISASRLNYHHQYQTDLNLIYYPLGNLNLYLSGSVYSLLEDPSLLTNDKRYATEGKIGFSLSRHAWVEAGFLSGEIKNMALGNGFIVYNSNETITSSYSLTLIFPSDAFTFSLRGAMNNYYSTFIDNQGYITDVNKLNFNGLTLTGELKWNF